MIVAICVGVLTTGHTDSKLKADRGWSAGNETDNAISFPDSQPIGTLTRPFS